MRHFLLNGRAFAALALAILLFSVAAQADVIILKDGYTIRGVKTVKEKAVVIDEKAGQIFLFTDPKGMVAIDDGPRWVVFPNSPAQVADVSENNPFKDYVSYTREFNAGDQVLPATARNPQTSSWNTKDWTREVRFNDEDPRLFHPVKQHINVLTPHYIRVGSSNYKIVRYFLTKEFKPDFIRSLLINHPDLQEKGKPDAEKRERLIRFWIQADWLDEADKDLEQLLAVLPAEKERYARLKGEVNGLRAENLMAEIERARDSGRHQAAIKALEAFPKEGVPKTVRDRVISLRAEYDLRTARFNTARRLLDELSKKLNAADNRFLAEGAATVRNEVHLDTLTRLDMFITLAERAEKDVKAGGRPLQSPEELIASAITGWHLGKVAAETKVGSAYKVWMARVFALDYLRNPQRGLREAALKQYLATPYALPYDELEKLVSLLPPPEAPASLPKDTAAVTLTPSVTYPNGVTFLVRLPEEYQPGRSYPLLILLADPAMDRTPDALLNEVGDLAARHGYIVAAPQWGWSSSKTTYNYTKEEQGTVLQMLRHLRRAYQVDSDRVFVCGNGEGAAMALDIGGGHPDLFAGVVSVNPSIHSKLFITCEYWVNFEKLPVYIVMGDKFGPSVNAIRMLCQRWMPRGFSSLVVSYKGRGQEWFTQEMPYAFDWMGRKHRADPGKMLGPSTFPTTTTPGFSSVRRTDNWFHWLSSEDIKPERTMKSVLISEATTPAKFSARILEGNVVDVKVTGMRQLTVWFGKGMLDYSKPVTVKVAGLPKPVTQKITPRIEVLMEDLYERGDRQRPYFERVDVSLK
jgi:pimeloyl-ACP methyl ester carboxylesterase